MGVQIKDLGAKAGVVLNPGTSLTAIEEVRILSLLTGLDEGCMQLCVHCLKS